MLLVHSTTVSVYSFLYCLCNILHLATLSGFYTTLYFLCILPQFPFCAYFWVVNLEHINTYTCTTSLLFLIDRACALALLFVVLFMDNSIRNDAYTILILEEENITSTACSFQFISCLENMGEHGINSFKLVIIIMKRMTYSSNMVIVCLVMY